MGAGNCITLIGRLTKDPVLRKTKTDKSVVNFSLARNERHGETEEVLYVDVTAWGKVAECVAKHKSKGDQIALVGRLSRDVYTDKAGNERSQTVIVADHVEFLAKKAATAANGAATDGSTASASRDGETELEELGF